MTLDVTTSTGRRGSNRIGRGTLVAASVAAVTIVTALAHAPTGHQFSEPALVRVLLFMALLKFAGAAAGVWLIDWRMRSPLSARLAVGYVAAVALMLAASTLIAMLAYIMAAALLYHAGLLGGLFLAWGDGRRRL